MKICILGKYPPIEGGVSSYNYWLARYLGRKGHKVFVVTNADEVEPEYREDILPKDATLLEPRNVKVLNTFPLSRRIIPQYPPFIAKLASLAIDVIRKEKIDALYSNYLLPYGVAAYIVKQATDVPWFLDHAGSDITNLFDEPLLRPVFIEICKKADLIINSPQVEERLIKTAIIDKSKKSLCIDVTFYTEIIADSFLPKIKPFNLRPYYHKFKRNLPVFTFFGKISQLKKTFAFVEAASYLPKGNFYLLFVTERGRMLISLRNLVTKFGLSEYSCFLPFQPPWLIPSIMNASTCIVAPESQEEPYLPKGTHGSRLCLEAMLCAKCALIGQKMSNKGFYPNCKDRKHFLIVNPNNTESFAKKLKLIIDNPSLAAKIGKEARRFWWSKIKFARLKSNLFLKNMHIAILKSQ